MRSLAGRRWQLPGRRSDKRAFMGIRLLAEGCLLQGFAYSRLLFRASSVEQESLHMKIHDQSEHSSQQA